MSNERLESQIDKMRKAMQIAVPVSQTEQDYIDHIRERSYVRHVLAYHIRTNDPRISQLRQKHGM